MKAYHKRRLRRNGNALPYGELPLFLRAASRPLSSISTAHTVAKVSRRFRVSMALAQTIAELASMHAEQDYAQ
jgi:hypothetical protein